MSKQDFSCVIGDIEARGAPPDKVLVCFMRFLDHPVMIGVAAGDGEAFCCADPLPVCRLDIGTGMKDYAGAVATWQSEWPKTRFVQSPSSDSGFQGRDLAEIPMRLRMTGTPFQHAIWRVLLSIPCGRTMTYSEIAIRLGKPKAARAVGMACGANPIPLIVPCHRVIAANGGLGGYSGRGGAVFKRELLRQEAIMFYCPPSRKILPHYLHNT